MTDYPAKLHFPKGVISITPDIEIHVTVSEKDYNRMIDLYEREHKVPLMKLFMKCNITENVSSFEFQNWNLTKT